MPLLQISSRATNATGSVTVSGTQVTLIDDSTIADATVGSSGRVYNIVSGSLTSGVYTPATPVYYGKFYPDHGVMVLDGNRLDQVLAFDTNVTSREREIKH